MREVHASAPGKVNLILRVGPPDAQGYHGLVTVFECLDIREHVTVRTAKSPGIHIETRAYAADGSLDQGATQLMAKLDPTTHLAYRAAKTLQKLAAAGPWAHTSAGVSIHVDKHIPIAGGMAGGSADAAAALVACNRLWGLGLTAEQLCQIGRQLGADVPACIMGGMTLGQGRGDLLTPLLDAQQQAWPRHSWVMVRALKGLSTPEVFRTLDAMDTEYPRSQPAQLSEAEREALCADPERLSRVLVNELTEPALELYPGLAGTLTDAREAGALAAIVSGSGPTIAVLARDDDHARHLARVLLACSEVSDTLTASGPAAGAIVEEEEC